MSQTPPHSLPGDCPLSTCLTNAEDASLQGNSQPYLNITKFKHSTWVVYLILNGEIFVH